MWRWWCLTQLSIFCRAEFWPVEFRPHNASAAYWRNMMGWIESGQAIESVEQVSCDIC